MTHTHTHTHTLTHSHTHTSTLSLSPTGCATEQYGVLQHQLDQLETNSFESVGRSRAATGDIKAQSELDAATRALGIDAAEDVLQP